mgnify:CR=1 FL=1
MAGVGLGEGVAESLLGGVDAQDRVGAWVARWVPRWVWMTPVKELTLLRRTEANFYGEKLILAAIGLVAPPLLSTLFNVFGLRFPIAVPLIASLVGAVGLFVLPNLDIHGKAKAARLEFNHVLTGFIDLVALERRAGSGPRQALENAARVGRGQWVFDRLAEGFTQSSVDGRPPWDVLRAMGDELALPVEFGEQRLGLLQHLTALRDFAELLGHFDQFFSLLRQECIVQQADIGFVQANGSKNTDKFAA